MEENTNPLQIELYIGPLVTLQRMLQVAIPQSTVHMRQTRRTFIYFITKDGEGRESETILGKIYGWKIASITQLVHYVAQWYNLENRPYDFSHFFTLQKYRQSVYGGDTNVYQEIKQGGLSVAYIFMPKQYTLYTGHPVKPYEHSLEAVDSTSLLAAIKTSTKSKIQKKVMRKPKKIEW